MSQAITNKEIVFNELMLQGKDFPYDGTNLLTYAEWKKRGYQVQKGQKAFLQVSLWIPITAKKKDKEESKQKQRFYLKKSSLFTIDQVAPIEQQQTA